MAPKPSLQTLEPRTSGVTNTHSNPCIVPPLTQGPATIRVYHLMAPNCWWSWGYYATLARIRLVYGNQVDLRLALHPVYTDMAHWLQHNGMDRAGWGRWAQESAQKMGVPVFTAYAKIGWSNDSTPAVLASVAAHRQGQPQGDRFVRALLRRSCVEGRDAASATEILGAAKESGLDLGRFAKDQKDVAGLEKELAAMGETMPGDVAAGFYNLIVEDAQGRKVVLNHAFDPAPVEAAIDFLSGGTLVKNRPTDPVEYLKATGPAPTLELARAFATTEEDVRRRLAALEAQRRVERVVLAGGEHWEAV
jgi:protein-disulfide isomerase-like protein with CxxC motif